MRFTYFVNQRSIEVTKWLQLLSWVWCKRNPCNLWLCIHLSKVPSFHPKTTPNFIFHRSIVLWWKKNCWGPALVMVTGKLLACLGWKREKCKRGGGSSIFLQNGCTAKENPGHRNTVLRFKTASCNVSWLQTEDKVSPFHGNQTMTFTIISHLLSFHLFIYIIGHTPFYNLIM